MSTRDQNSSPRRQPEPGRRWRLVHHVLGALLVAGWLVALGAQASRRGPTLLDIADLPPPSPDGRVMTYGVYYGDKKIGFSEQRREPREQGGAIFHDRAYWRFKAQGAVQRLALESHAEVDAAWRLLRFSARIDAGLAKLSVEATVLDDAIEIELRTGGRVERDTLPIDGPILLPALVRSFVAARDPEPGTSLQLQIYNPLLRSTDTLDVLVEERTEDGWRISEIMRSSMKTSAWIDREGMTLREENALGFRMQAEPREQAMLLPEESDSVPDLVFAAAVPVSGQLPADPRVVRSMRVRVLGVELDAFPALSGALQRRDHDLLEVRAEPWPETAGYRLPRTRDASATGSHIDAALLASEALQESLRAAPLVQSDDPALVQKAWDIVGDSDDPVEAARSLATWVHKSLRKVNSVGVPSAVEVLRSQRGDCNEHTVLYTALARAVGIPTRMAAGVVLADLNGDGPGFYYHAWPEVWLGRWVSLDPTFGQVPADATHLRFILGGLDRQVDILRLIGSLRVEIQATELQAVADKEASP